jgi:uncharacterized phage protein gp47/JayE
VTAPTEREFVVYARGEVRELILANYRNGLRTKTDPDTSDLFTEDTIRLVTQEGSRFYVWADSVDLALLGAGKRAEYLAQQISHDRASSAFLKSRHAPLWGEEFLPGFSSTGTVLATGTAGTTWVGSTDLPDALATTGTDPAGNRYQVYITGVADADGNAELTLASIDTGDEVNIAVGTKITWTNPPPGSAPTAEVITEDFDGGSPAEDDAAFSARLGARIAHKPAAGNDAQFRAWAREASVAVEDAFIYPTAFNAGSVLVVPVQKRGSSTSPTARIPNATVLTAVTERVVPPASPVVPPHVRVMVVAPVPATTDVALLLSLLKGSSVGWADADPFPPWPNGAVDFVEITLVTTQLNVRVDTGTAGQLPGGVAGPLTGVSLMVWKATTGGFEVLDVASVADLGGGIYRIILNAPASFTLALGDLISPLTLRHSAIALGARNYFDSLGPGEVVNLSSDPRGVSAFRRPPPSEEFPARAGQAIITDISEALGSALADAQLDQITVAVPTVPSDPSDGPELIVIGKLAVYPLE